MSSSLADTMRLRNAVDDHKGAAARWYFVYDPGASSFRRPENLDELFQLVTALALSGYVGRAWKVALKYPLLFEGKMGGDTWRVLGIGELIRGNIEESVRCLTLAVETHSGTSDPKLALDQVAFARVHLVQDNAKDALEYVGTTAQMVQTFDADGETPIARHVDYWRVIVEPATTGAVDLKLATRVSEADKALHRRKFARRLQHARDPQGVAWDAVRREHAVPTRGIFLRRPVAENDDPWGWFLS